MEFLKRYPVSTAFRDKRNECTQNPKNKGMFEGESCLKLFGTLSYDLRIKARRGKGVFEKVMAAMDRLRERGVPFGTSLTVTSENVEDITTDEFFGHLTEKGVLVCWLFLFMPVGKDPSVKLMPTPEQREYLRQRDSELREKYPI